MLFGVRKIPYKTKALALALLTDLLTHRLTYWTAPGFKSVSFLTCIPDSYTHLRAHETLRNLVCRRLPGKKKRTSLF